MKAAVALALLALAAPGWLQGLLHWPPTPPEGAHLIVDRVGGDLAVAVAYAGVREPPMLEASMLGINVDVVAVSGCDSLSWGVEGLPGEAVAVALGDEGTGLCRVSVTIAPAAMPAAPGALYIEWPGGLLAVTLLNGAPRGLQAGGQPGGLEGGGGGSSDYRGPSSPEGVASRDNPWIPVILLAASLAAAVVAELGVQRRP